MPGIDGGGVTSPRTVVAAAAKRLVGTSPRLAETTLGEDPQRPPQPAAAGPPGGAWTSADTFVMTWQFIETAFRDTVACRLDGDELLIDRSVNINAGPLSLPTFHGTPA
jgi:hypothetical protein